MELKNIVAGIESGIKAQTAAVDILRRLMEGTACTPSTEPQAIVQAAPKPKSPRRTAAAAKKTDDKKPPRRTAAAAKKTGGMSLEEARRLVAAADAPRRTKKAKVGAERPNNPFFMSNHQVEMRCGAMALLPKVGGKIARIAGSLKGIKSRAELLNLDRTVVEYEIVSKTDDGIEVIRA